ncbi:MAG: hypothetical protein IPP59_11490 [Betaproteobacteria bacterium]|nr:hypothetical protein [Candidatus Dechloromonas phosphorivorans]
MAIIFLDFDGVLHPADYLSFKTINDELVLASDARFCWVEDLWNLIHNFDCHLIIHSSWRNSYTLEQLRNLLPVELGKRVVAITAGDNRHQSILGYVESLELRVTSFSMMLLTNFQANVSNCCCARTTWELVVQKFRTN